MQDVTHELTLIVTVGVAVEVLVTVDVTDSIDRQLHASDTSVVGRPTRQPGTPDEDACALAVVTGEEEDLAVLVGATGKGDDETLLEDAWTGAGRACLSFSFWPPLHCTTVLVLFLYVASVEWIFSSWTRAYAVVV